MVTGKAVYTKGCLTWLYVSPLQRLTTENEGQSSKPSTHLSEPIPPQDTSELHRQCEINQSQDGMLVSPPAKHNTEDTPGQSEQHVSQQNLSMSQDPQIQWDPGCWRCLQEDNPQVSLAWVTKQKLLVLRVHSFNTVSKMKKMSLPTLISLFLDFTWRMCLRLSVYLPSWVTII